MLKLRNLIHSEFDASYVSKRALFISVGFWPCPLPTEIVLDFQCYNVL